MLLLGVTASGPVYSAGGEYLAEGEQASTLEVTFRLYAGGIPFGDVSMSSRIQGDRYAASSTIETAGLINRFWESKIEAASNGTIGESEVKPARYDNFTTRRGRREEYVISFRDDGPDSIYTNPQRAEREDDLPPGSEAARHSMDPVSAMVFLMNSYEANQETPCQTVAPVYDGRRRYDVAFRLVKNDTVRMDNGLYAGPVMECEVIYRQVAGDDQYIVDEDDNELPAVFAWIAEFPSAEDSERHYLVPIRLWSNTEFGVITAVATDLRVDGKPVEHGT